MNVDQVKKSDQEHKLMFESFKLSLSRPTTNQLAKAFLANEDCNRIQSENNLSFLNRVGDVVYAFVKRNELEYEKYNNDKANPECECDYDCECYLNEFIMPAFNNLAIKFEPYIDDYSLVNHILEEFKVEEKERLLGCNLRELLRLALFKELAYLAFDYRYYGVSCYHHEFAVLIYGGVLTKERFDPSEYIQNDRKARTEPANKARWDGHVEELRRRYLELDTKRQSELGKNLTIKDVAIWIHDHHNPEELAFETIRDHLSKARKGIFIND